MVGYSLKTIIDQVFAETISINIKGANSIVGGMAAYNQGTDTAIISRNFLTGMNLTVNPTASASIVGGIAGINDARNGGIDNPVDILTAVSSVQNSRSVGSITVLSPDSIVGGAIGENRALVANNSVTDSIPVVLQGDNGLVGGLAGKNTAIVYYTYSNTALTIGGTGTSGGGLVGENTSTGKVLSSYIETDLVSNANGTANSYAYLGGLIGKNAGVIEKSYVDANVTANGVYACVGGLVGEHSGAGAITNSYVAQTVNANNANSFAGGLLGLITTGTVANCYSADQVTGVNGAYAGGFIGRYENSNKELISACYYV
jgi:hypothetical protein